MREGRSGLAPLWDAGQGSTHLHLACSDSTGATFGGHLMDGCGGRTAAGVMLAELPDRMFAREPGPTYGYRELWPRRR